MSTNSTGPRTEGGKERSSLNAIKHGMRSERAVIPGEDPAEWEAFRDGIVAHFMPVGIYENVLAERVALQMWRLQRVGQYEAQAVADDMAARQAEAAEGGERKRAAKSELEKVIRYEAHVSRQLKEAEQMLRAAQAARLEIAVRETQAKAEGSSFGARREAAAAAKSAEEPNGRSAEFMRAFERELDAFEAATSGKRGTSTLRT